MCRYLPRPSTSVSVQVLWVAWDTGLVRLTETAQCVPIFVSFGSYCSLVCCWCCSPLRFTVLCSLCPLRFTVLCSLCPLVVTFLGVLLVLQPIAIYCSVLSVSFEIYCSVLFVSFDSYGSLDAVVAAAHCDLLFCALCVL
jgi:hypothetical protein